MKGNTAIVIMTLATLFTIYVMWAETNYSNCVHQPDKGLIRGYQVKVVVCEDLRPWWQ